MSGTAENLTRWSGQAIVTAYHGPGNRRGACITAAAWGGKVRVDYDHGARMSERHYNAAMALVAKMGWPADGWIEAGLPDGKGRVFVRPLGISQAGQA